MFVAGAGELLTIYSDDSVTYPRQDKQVLLHRSHRLFEDAADDFLASLLGDKSSFLNIDF